MVSSESFLAQAEVARPWLAGAETTWEGADGSRFPCARCTAVQRREGGAKGSGRRRQRKDLGVQGTGAGAGMGREVWRPGWGRSAMANLGHPCPTMPIHQPLPAPLSHPIGP